ncbi:MAG TPA: SDR family NAD(P)-dependent oxidoreductase [Rhodospirillales bacterium]|nr:SDR family NAD(P)-dependent oxidoreductase [Rhodospirillales bacterium]
MVASGAAVSLWDREAERLTATADALPAKGAVHWVRVDVTDSRAVDAAFADTLAWRPFIDILIVNAGVAGGMKMAFEYTDEDWERMLGENLTSVFRCCRTVLPHMVGRGYGRIVVVSLIAGMEGAASNAGYSVAKAGAIGFTKALGKELAASGVFVNCVASSGIDTEILAGLTRDYLDAALSRMPMGRLWRPEEVAALITWLASEECSFSTGAVFDASGGRAVY